MMGRGSMDMAFNVAFGCSSEVEGSGMESFCV